MLFNSNGTLLTRKWRNELISSGLDELRISLDTPDPEVYAQIRGRPLFSQVVENVRALVSAQTRLRAQSPRVSIWSVANRATLRQLPALIRLAASIGVHEVYIQRLTFAVQREQRYGMATPEHAVFGTLSTGEMCILQECAKLANELGVDLEASGATTPAGSLRAECDSEHRPWWSCLRPWTTTYVTANGNVLPCCMAHWADTNYESLMLGSIWERPFAEIWNDAPYQAWREALLGDHPSRACSGCGVFWSL